MATKKSTKKATKKVAKKAVTKTAKKKTKKTTTKKATAKKNTKQKVLVCADDDQCFWTTDGQILKDMQELATALDSMAEEVFSHHVTSDRNDFADWVEHVLEDAACATALRKSRKPSSARTVIIRHLKTYAV